MRTTIFSHRRSSTLPPIPILQIPFQTSSTILTNQVPFFPGIYLSLLLRCLPRLLLLHLLAQLVHVARLLEILLGFSSQFCSYLVVAVWRRVASTPSPPRHLRPSDPKAWLVSALPCPARAVASFERVLNMFQFYLLFLLQDMLTFDLQIAPKWILVWCGPGFPGRSWRKDRLTH